MKTILGLDLGTTSIGWALILDREQEELMSLIGYLIPLDKTKMMTKTQRKSQPTQTILTLQTTNTSQ